MYSKDMFIRRGIALLLLCALVPLVWAQQADSVFPPNDPLRSVVEPLQVGMEAFSGKIQAIKAQGREPLGLVLAGGSARAYSYIGMLEVLESRGIMPDFIVANSMGAIIGLLYAAGLSPAMIEELVTTVPTEKYFDFVLPSKGGLINVDAFEAVIRDLVGQVDLSELHIPIIVTAEDLTTRRRVEIAAGELSRAMTSSFAMPAIFEPKPFGDTLLVDGGSTTLVPIAQAAAFSSRLIVATALYNKPMSFENPITVLNRVFDIGKTRTGMEDLFGLSPFVIRNDVETVSYMEFAYPEAIIQRGRRSAEAVADELLSWLPGENRQVGISPALAEKRAQYQTAIPGGLDAYRRGALPPLDGNLRLSPRLGLLRSIQPPVAGFDDTGFAGLGTSLAAGRSRAFLGLLVSFTPESGKAWAAAADLLVNPYDSLLWTSAFRLYGDFATRLPYLAPASLEFSTGLAWELGEKSKTFEPYAASNLRYSFDTAAFGWDAEAGLSLGSILPYGANGGAESSDTEMTASGIADASSGHLEGSYTLRAAAFAQDGANAFGWGPSLGVSAGISKADLVALRARASGRYALNGADIGLGPRELYRGTAASIAAPFTAAAGAELVWLATALRFETGEILLVDSIELGPYIDSIWSEDFSTFTFGAGFMPEAFTAGLSLSATLRFAGLRPFELSFFAGMDNSGDLALGIRSGRL